MLPTWDKFIADTPHFHPDLGPPLLLLLNPTGCTGLQERYQARIHFQALLPTPIQPQQQPAGFARCPSTRASLNGQLCLSVSG